MAKGSASNVEIFSPEGEKVSVARLNAIDLVRTSGYRWSSASAAESEELAEPEPEEDTTEDEPESENTEEGDDNEEDEFNVDSAPLSEVAERITGNADVEKYLKGFSADALRDLAEKRYDTRLHPRAGQDKCIEKILELEDEKVRSELD